MKIHDTIEMQPVDRLVPYARNSRTHTDEQVLQIVASIREFGFTNPVMIDEGGGVIAGHGRIMAARKMDLPDVPCIRLEGLSEAQKRAYVIADNQLALNAGWDEELLALEIKELQGLEFDLDLLGFDTTEIDQYLTTADATREGETDPDETPEPPVEPISRRGDVWRLGKHRVMCGDSTAADDVAILIDGQVGALMHADPPYGMGKASDGVMNDNLYRERLDAFQMAWWATWRPHLADNASAYIWGNAPDLWRLWYAGGLADSEQFTFRNEITWDKKSIAGMKSPDNLSYPTASDRCLYFQFGQQFVGNINTADFPEAWEPLRGFMEAEAKEHNITAATVKEVCGCDMYWHWFTRSQYTLIPQRHYKALAAAYPGAFVRPWSELKQEWDRVKGGGRSIIKAYHDGMRSYFDNAHDAMRDCWEFSRVTGDERHGHATPKPVDMMERVMRSSLPPGGLCFEPFGGSGSTLMGAERTGRVCYTMEMQAQYVDVIVQRWQNYTGQQATNAITGEPYSG